MLTMLARACGVLALAAACACHSAPSRSPSPAVATRPAEAQPLAGGTTGETTPARTADGVSCGKERCAASQRCCASTRACLSDSDECPPNQSGGTYETSCDGPEDCPPGEVCCSRWFGALMLAACSSEECGPTTADGDGRSQLICHQDDDCDADTACTGDLPMYAAKVRGCEPR